VEFSLYDAEAQEPLECRAECYLAQGGVGNEERLVRNSSGRRSRMRLVAVGFLFERMTPVEGQGPREPDKEDYVNIVPGVGLYDAML